MAMKVPFCKATLGKEEEEAVLRVIRSGWLAAGPETEAFEREFADYIAETSDDGFARVRPYCIFTASCTAALKIAYKIAKSQGYTDIIYPENTFCATYSAAEEVGIKTHPLKDAGIIELPDVQRARLAMVSMHYGGVRHDLPDTFIEDSAHRIEKNDPLVGKIRTYSFYVTKNMTTSSGGMFVTNDKEIYEQARLYWRDGLSSSTHDRQTGKSWDYRVAAMAGGYDGDDLRAAIGREQLKKLPYFTQRRNEVRDRYNQAFGRNWLGNHLYVYDTDSPEQAGQLIEFLKAKGVSAGYHYPGTGWTGVSLPIFPLLTMQEQDYVIEKVREWHREVL